MIGFTWYPHEKAEKRLHSQSDLSDIDYVIRQNNREIQTQSRTDKDKLEEKVVSTKAFNSTPVDISQVDVHTFRKSNVNRVRNEVDGVILTVEARRQDATLTAIESLVIPKLELTMK